jgi:hypothetical protein
LDGRVGSRRHVRLHARIRFHSDAVIESASLWKPKIRARRRHRSRRSKGGSLLSSQGWASSDARLQKSPIARATLLHPGKRGWRRTSRVGASQPLLTGEPHIHFAIGRHPDTERQRRCRNRRRPSRTRSRAAPAHPLIARIVHLDRSLLVNSRNLLSMLL